MFAEGDARIQRRSPVLPLSWDADRVAALQRSLAVYRMVVGQPRQDDLLEFVLREVPDDQRDDLPAAVTIDLSPLMSPLNRMPSKRVQWYCVPSNTAYQT